RYPRFLPGRAQHGDHQRQGVVGAAGGRRAERDRPRAVEGRKARPLAVDSILQVQEVSKRFGGLAALTRVSVEVARGTITALIGPNGSGKTTLFNVICGLLPGDGGAVAFEGAPITGLAPHEIVARGLGRTFQQTRLFPSLTILENLQLPQHSRGAVGIAG